MEMHARLPDGYEAQAAALYWDAFKGKLTTLMGPDDRARRFFTDTINSDAVIAATEHGTLLGMVAFKHNGQGFSSGGVADLWHAYGTGAIWRLIPLAMLEREAPRAVLQMDGICVAPEARGKGVGQALFAALFEMAKTRGYRAVQLDVIDSNTRAKALYLRLGFQDMGAHSVWPLRRLLGFQSATRMMRTL
ncbi:GNAT family N-acetyltransferase [uncultured Tateyamaria sp.]|uniref:GNAT family N-acetyltransferase n=1 Tax=Tateyamaria sp. 1078 TaxID=3417464 RepID=UPI00260953AD|nr:GNAT family N-acetyltransferase [uncultured Tateyamaria sp.]